jgi:phosphoribosylamine--glycine ligase
MTMIGVPRDAQRAVLLIDHQTGRAHALADLFLRTDPDIDVYYGPGHPAIHHDRLISVPEIRLDDVDTVIGFCERTAIQFVFVSWINSLALGYVDDLRRAGIRVVGPSRAGAELESSKRRGKEFCAAHGLPVAPYATFTDPLAAVEYVRSRPYSVVVKEDGLTEASDGAWVCADVREAEEAILATLDRMGEDFTVVIERRLEGEDVSLLALTDGQHYVMLPPALDYKRASDSDAGINCDGMGTVAPHPAMDAERLVEARRIFDRTMAGFAAEGIHYTGFLYIGAMITDDGVYVLEINSRMGDSEAQAVLPAIQSSFAGLCEAILAGNIAHAHVDLDTRVRCCVNATQGRLAGDDPSAKPGWPFGAYETGQLITGVDDVERDKAIVFLAGTGVDQYARHVTTRGRVLNVVGHGDCLTEAVDNAYAQLSRISFAGMRYRTDIGSIEARARR